MKDYAVDGWEIKGIETLEAEGAIQLGRGKVISKKDLAATPGRYPVYSSAKENNGKFGEYGHFMFDEELITWSVDGGGCLFHRPKHKFSITNVGGFVRILEPERIDCRYLYFALSFLHSKVKFDWVRKAHPSVIRKVYDEIPLPSLKEQQRIVVALDETFEGMAHARANAEANLENARELFERFLGDQFLHSGAGNKTCTVGDLITLQRGFDITKKDQREGPFPVVSSGGAKSHHDTAMAKAPGVVIGRKGSIGNVYFVEEDFWPHDTTLWVKDFKGNDPQLVYYLMRGLSLIELDTGAANPSLNRNLVHPLVVSWPDEIDQSEVSARICRVETKALELQRHYLEKLQDLDDLRQSLLQKAFAGELT